MEKEEGGGTDHVAAGNTDEGKSRSKLEATLIGESPVIVMGGGVSSVEYGGGVGAVFGSSLQEAYGSEWLFICPPKHSPLFLIPSIQA